MHCVVMWPTQFIYMIRRMVCLWNCSGNLRWVGCTAGVTRSDLWMSWWRKNWAQSARENNYYFWHFTGFFVFMFYLMCCLK